MRFSIKTKQVVGVVLLVALAVTALSAIYTALVAGVLLTETQSRGEMLRTFVFERAQRVITSKEDAYAALRSDSGLRSLLESSMAYSRHVTYAALVDPRNVVIVHSSPVLEGQVLEPQAQLEPLLGEDPWTQIQAISSEGTFEVSERLLLGNEGENEFGTIRIGISTALIWEDLLKTMRTAVLVGLAALAVSTLVALLLAQWTLRPVHVLQSGFARLGRGEFGVKLDLPAGDEFSELGASFNKLSAELSTVRSQLATDSAAPVESVVDRLEDAVAMVNPDGQVVFANAAIRAALPEAAAGSKLTAWPQLHPYREIVERALATRQSVGPLSRRLTLSGDGEDDETEQWLMAHALLHADQRFMGVMLVARDLGYLGQVQSTLRYSQKAAALGRLLAGVAHEVKNPLNAMTIHLELLKQKLGGGGVARPVARAAEAGGVPRRRCAAGAGHRRIVVGAQPRLGDRQRDSAPRRGGAGLPEVQPARGAGAGARRPGGDGHRRRRRHRPAGDRGRRPSRHLAGHRSAAGQRRQQPAPAGAPESGVERRPGDALGRPPALRVPAGRRSPGRARHQRHGRGHPARAPVAHF